MKNLNIKINKIQTLGEGDHANCWGTTLYLLGINKKLKWEKYAPTTFALKKCFSLVTKSDYKVGDVLVLKNNGATVHTAIYIGHGKWFHKAGSLSPAKQYLKTIVNFFDFCSDSYEIRRFNRPSLIQYEVFKDMQQYVDIDYDDIYKI